MNVALLWPLNALLILSVEGKINMTCLRDEIDNVSKEREGLYANHESIQELRDQP